MCSLLPDVRARFPTHPHRCNVPQRNRTKMRPLQIAAGQSYGNATCATFPGRNRTEFRPLQIARTQSDGISTSATLLFAQVAFSSGFFVGVFLPMILAAHCPAKLEGISTCAKPLFAQVAFSSGFFSVRSASATISLRRRSRFHLSLTR